MAWPGRDFSSGRAIQINVSLCLRKRSGLKLLRNAQIIRLSQGFLHELNLITELLYSIFAA
ncbi:hypothetical protein HNQ53_000224 [Microbulbifer hydrolyticus]|uniref:Uncharacterized protein n=1 Tax=Microbulbifer hydrolyticus TaxID=48074 RepID=A0AA89PE94_9GAMM|nr:hypothetical protein [Microbulbifer hydrolyticus]